MHTLSRCRARGRVLLWGERSREAFRATATWSCSSGGVQIEVRLVADSDVNEPPTRTACTTAGVASDAAYHP